jgi:hypothetical protein
MKKVNIHDLNKHIDNNKSEVERMIIRDRENTPIVRTRKRDVDEQKVLDKLCIKRWEDAEREGKVKYITERKWYYAFD